MAMRPCKECNQEISSSAKKCPHCGKDQRNFFMRHKIITILGVFIILGMLASMGSDNDNTATTANSGTGNEATQTVSEVPKETSKQEQKQKNTLMENT